jgi:hypothetical protein
MLEADSQQANFPRPPLAGTLIALSTIFILIFSSVSAPAQGGKHESAKQLEEALARSRAEVINAAGEYKESLEKLITLIEKDVAAARENLDKRKTLFAEQLISRRELDESHRELIEAEDKLSDARRQIAEADLVVAEAIASEQMDKLARARREAFISTTSLIRFSGNVGWTLGESSKVEGFFTSRFGRALPVTAFGQSATHTRLGWDHSNSFDVGVHPDSPEGQALIAYLRGAGIPFLAFRTAIAGSSTGPHIHVGYPSHRLNR